MLAVSSGASLYLLYRLHSRPGHWLEKVALTAVLLVPFLGWLAYLFLVENVPPQHEDLKNRGPRGFYSDWMISRTRFGPEGESRLLQGWADLHATLIAARGYRVVHDADDRTSTLKLESDAYTGEIIYRPGGDYDVRFRSLVGGQEVLAATGLQWGRNDLLALLRGNDLL